MSVIDESDPLCSCTTVCLLARPIRCLVTQNSSSPPAFWLPASLSLFSSVLCVLLYHSSSLGLPMSIWGCLICKWTVVCFVGLIVRVTSCCRIEEPYLETGLLSTAPAFLWAEDKQPNHMARRVTAWNATVQSLHTVFPTQFHTGTLITSHHSRRWTFYDSMLTVGHNICS